MQLTQLTIRDFRNLPALDVELPPDGAVIIGENGHGKTNFLEAICDPFPFFADLTQKIAAGREAFIK